MIEDDPIHVKIKIHKPTRGEGYKAIQLGFGKIKNSKLSKQMKGFYSKKSTEAKRKLKEVRVSNTENYKEGNEFGIQIYLYALSEKKSFTNVNTAAAPIQCFQNGNICIALKEK